MANIRAPITIGLAGLIAAGHIYDPTAFKDTPPRASIPITMGSSTISGPTGPAGSSFGLAPVVNAVTGAVIDPRGPVGLLRTSKA